MTLRRVSLFVLCAILMAVAYYALSPLFITTVRNDAVPTGGREGSGSLNAASVVGTPLHRAEGTARIVEAEGKKFLRYENFSTINGPDLFVYLARDVRATDFVNLGPLKATEGNVNYEIPDGTALEAYPYALVWCRAFGVLFNYAELKY